MVFVLVAKTHVKTQLWKLKPLYKKLSGYDHGWSGERSGCWKGRGGRREGRHNKGIGGCSGRKGQKGDF